MRTLTPRVRATLLVLLAGLVVGLLTAPRRLADASTYVLAVASLYADGDLTYAPVDLARAQTMQFDDLPNGLFLVRRDGQYVYGKPFLYPLAALPFYAAFGVRGFMVLNGLLLAALILLGADILSHRLAWPRALLASAIVFGFTVTVAYLFWIDPFLLACTLVAAAVAAYRRDHPLLAALPLALLAFVRAPYALLAVAPAALYASSRRWRMLVSYAAGVILVGATLVGVEWARTGTWATYTGQRFYYRTAFPYQRELDEPQIGIPSSVDVGRIEWPGLTEVLRRNAYFAAGRFAGIVPYFPTLLACLVWSRRWDREKWLWLLALIATCEALQFAMPYNPFGGRHTLGNRLFVLLPVALLWVEAVRATRWRLAATAALLAVAVPVVEKPYYLSLHPGRQMLDVPYRYLPFEWPDAANINFPFQLGGMGALSANQYDWEDGAVWTRGATTADFVMFRRHDQTEPIRLWSFLPHARVVDGDVLLPLDWLPGRDIDIVLSHPVAYFIDDRGSGERYDVYRLRITTDDGTPASSVSLRKDNRFVGVRVRPLSDPRE